MKALGYIRFSSDEQKDGNSIERQEAHIKAYAEREGLTLTEILVDDGYSASKGHHISKGKFGKFLANLPKYKGFALVVEEMDRLDRRGIEETRTLLASIINAGIEIHVTQENRVIRDTNDFISALLNLVQSHGAAEYSRKLRERIGRAWSTKKASNKVMTTNLPAWLKVEGRKVVNGKVVEAGTIVIDEKQAQLVNRVFELAANGLGSKKIRIAMNGANLSRIWISKTLSNRAVLGEFQPMKYEAGKRIPDGEVRFDYYPRVISDELFRSARAEIDRKNHMDSETRKFKGGARNSDRADNLFSGLLYDERGRSLWYQKKGGNNTSTFLVSACDADGPSYRLRYGRLEAELLGWLGKVEVIDWNAIVKSGNDPVLTSKEAKLSELNDATATAEAKVNARNTALEALDDPAAISVVARQVAKLETELGTIAAERETLAAEVDALRAKTNALSHPERLQNAIVSLNGDNNTRLALRTEIRRMFQRIELDFSGSTFPGLIFVTFVFQNGARLEALGFARQPHSTAFQ